jgi:hypothetical protein
MKVFISTGLVFTVGFLCVPLVRSQVPEIDWTRTYGGSGNDVAYSVQQTNDSGYIFTGSTESFGADSVDVYLVKTNNIGNMQWFRIFGGSDYDEALSVKQTNDSGYILTGVTCSFGVGPCDMYLVKTDNQGDTVWTRTYGRSYTDGARSVCQTTDGGYILAGSSTPFLGALIEIYLVKTDSNGDTLWTRTYGGSDHQGAYSVQQTRDGGYIIAGCNPIHGGVHDIYLLKVDSLGDTLWARTYGGPDDDNIRSVQQTMDGGFIMVGWTDSYGAGSDDAYVVKTDSLGDILWSRTLGGSNYDWAYDVQQTEDADYIIAGNTSSYGNGESDLYLIRLDSTGDTLWTLVYGGSDYDEVTSIDLTSDGGYIIGGYTWNWETPADCWLLKTGPDTAVSGAPVIEWMSHPKDFILHPAYPNPFNPTTTISYDVPVQGLLKVNIYNVLGQKTAELVNSITTAGRHQLTWNATDSPSGIYFVQLQSQGNTQIRKIVLIK